MAQQPLQDIPWERPPGVKVGDTGGKLRTTMEEVEAETEAELLAAKPGGKPGGKPAPKPGAKVIPRTPAPPPATPAPPRPSKT